MEELVHRSEFCSNVSDLGSKCCVEECLMDPKRIFLCSQEIKLTSFCLTKVGGGSGESPGNEFQV